MQDNSTNSKPNKYSESARRAWAKRTPEERSKRMAELVSKRWAKVSVKDRKAYSAKMHEAKKTKAA